VAGLGAQVVRNAHRSRHRCGVVHAGILAAPTKDRDRRRAPADSQCQCPTGCEEPVPKGRRGQAAASPAPVTMSARPSLFTSNTATPSPRKAGSMSCRSNRRPSSHISTAGSGDGAAGQPTTKSPRTRMEARMLRAWRRLDGQITNSFAVRRSAQPQAVHAGASSRPAQGRCSRCRWAGATRGARNAVTSRQCSSPC